MRQTTPTQSGAPRPISHTSIQCMNFLDIFNISLDLSATILLILVSVELVLCIGPFTKRHKLVHTG